MGSAESGLNEKLSMRVNQLSDRCPGLARWLKGDLASCDSEIKSLNTQAALSTAEDAPVFSNGGRGGGGRGNSGTLSKELRLLFLCLASNCHQHPLNTHWVDA